MTATLPDRDDALVERLLKSSARQSYDPDVDIDWEAPEVPGLYWMQPERISLYGTPLWDRLSEEQRVELSKHEIASIASVGLWFELVLMQLLLKDVYRSDPTAPGSWHPRRGSGPTAGPSADRQRSASRTSSS